jgi:hypothetical protein
MGSTDPSRAEGEAHAWGVRGGQPPGQKNFCVLKGQNAIFKQSITILHDIAMLLSSITQDEFP